MSMPDGQKEAAGGKKRQDLKLRTKRFALDVIRFCCALPRTPECVVVTRQLMRSATSVGANYRAACRSRSRADFVAKLALVEEEADESLYWLELLSEFRISAREELVRLMNEAGELVAIVVASKKTARNGGLLDLRHSQLVTPAKGVDDDDRESEGYVHSRSSSDRRG
jgi:four helix bundle protein